MADPNFAHFHFTKLLVNDLEKSAAFYKSVCGLTEINRVQDTINGRPISEILFEHTKKGGGYLVLLKFLDTDKPVHGEVILGFRTANLEAFLERVRAAGGRVTDEIRSMPEHNLRVAFVEDVEGHLIEVVEMFQS